LREEKSGKSLKDEFGKVQKDIGRGEKPNDSLRVARSRTGRRGDCDRAELPTGVTLAKFRTKGKGNTGSHGCSNRENQSSHVSTAKNRGLRRLRIRNLARKTGKYWGQKQPSKRCRVAKWGGWAGPADGV